MIREAWCGELHLSFREFTRTWLMLLYAHPPKLCPELCSGTPGQGRTQKILLIPSVKFSRSVVWDSLRSPSNALGFLYSSVGKESACNAGDPGSIPRSGRFPGEGNGNPLQYACLENSMDKGDLPDPGIKPRSPALQADSLLTELWGKSCLEQYLI